MFDKIRDGIKNSFLVKVLMGLMIMSFGVLGIGDFIGTGALDPNVALKVGEREIDLQEFQRRYDQEYTRFKESVGNRLPDTEVMRRSVMTAMIQEMTRAATIDAAAENLGIIIPEEELRSTIRDMDAFKGPDGEFSQISFGEVLQQNSLTEPGFLDLLRSDLRRQTLLQPVALGSEAPQYLVDSLFTYRAEARVADTLLVRTSAIKLGEKPTDEELQTIYRQNTATFMRPELRKISVISMRGTDLVKPESFSEEEVRDYYDNNATRFRTPERRRISQLIFDTQAEAEKVRALAAPGDTLADLAKKAKIAPPVDLGEQASTSIIGRAMGDAYGLPLNEISPVVQSDLGWHLFSTTAITPEHVTPFEEAKTTIRKTMAEDRGLDAVYKTATELQDALAAGTPMPNIAKNLGVPILQVEAVDQNGKDPQGNDVPGLFDRTALLASVFDLPLNGDSGLRDLPGREGYYVVKVEGISAPAPKTLDEVRTDVVALWSRDKATAEARKIADGLAAEIGASTTLSNLETKDGTVSYGVIGPVNRFGQAIDPSHLMDTGRMNAGMLQKLFAAKPGEVFTSVVPDGVVIARLREVEAPRAVGALANERTRLADTLRNAVASDMMEQMNAAFSALYPVQVNQTVVDDMVKSAR